MTTDGPLTGNVRRHRTALQRYACSRPLAAALADGIIATTKSVFDYGCGHGADVRYLRKQKIPADGWDPFHRPGGVLTVSDVVTLSYVLNVIEHPAERTATLVRAFGFAREALVVAVRVDRSLEHAAECGDGRITAAGTFQKIFTQAEFRAYVESTLGRRSHAAGLGILYVFANDAAEASFLASRAFTRRLEYRTDLLAEFKKHRGAQRYVALANQLGRMPLPEEFRGYEKLIDAFGSAKRLERLALYHVNKDAFAGSQAQRREDIMVYVAMLRLQGIKPPPLAALAPSVRSDIKTLWPTYGAVQTEGEAFLYRMGDPALIKETAARAGLGKLVSDDLYVHRSLEDDLPPLLRLVIFAAKQLVGDVGYNVVKLRLDGRALSFLNYENFEDDPHPVLQSSVRVYLPKASYDIRVYSSSENPPILHRKDALIHPADPLYKRFRALTQAEEQAGLLNAPNIGYLSGWQSALRERHVTVRDHQLYLAADNAVSVEDSRGVT